jgi:uncharacterized coiled-coil protein SlyX
MAIVAKLPELRQQLREIEERLKALETKAAAKPASGSKPKPASTPKANSKRKR